MDDKQPIVKNWGYELREIVPVVGHPSVYLYQVGGKQGPFRITMEFWSLRVACLRRLTMNR